MFTPRAVKYQTSKIEEHRVEWVSDGEGLLFFIFAGAPIGAAYGVIEIPGGEIIYRPLSALTFLNPTHSKKGVESENEA